MIFLCSEQNRGSMIALRKKPGIEIAGILFFRKVNFLLTFDKPYIRICHGMIVVVLYLLLYPEPARIQRGVHPFFIRLS